MKINKPEGNNGAAPDTLRAAAGQFERAILEFETAANLLLSNEGRTSTEAENSARRLRSAANVYFTEKQKIENSSKKDHGIVHDFAIDFESARAEIGRRMACLRAARDAGEISE